MTKIFVHFCFFIALSFLSFWAITHLSADTDMLIYGMEASNDQVQSQFSIFAFLHWLSHVMKGDFGVSQYHQVPVLQLIMPAIKISGKLMGLSLVLTGLMTSLIFSGFVISHYRVKYLIKHMLDFLIIVPNLLIALILIVLFCLIFPIFPLFANGEALFLPAFIIAICQSIILSKLILHNFLLEKQKHYVQTSKAKGNTDHRTILKHLLINSLYPLVNHIIVLINSFLGSTLIVEIIFNIKGINYTLYQAVEKRDTPVLMACLLLFYLIITVIQILNDRIVKHV